MAPRRHKDAGGGARTCNLGVFFRASRGNVAVIFALILPLLLVTALGATQLNQVMTDKKHTQDVADSAALMGASQIAVTPGGVEQRTQSYALAQLADVASNASVTVQATGGQNGLMTVAVDTQRVSFFGNLLPLGGFHTHVTSTAKGVNSVPLCVLSLSGTGLGSIHVTGLSQLLATSCLVHSNQGLTVDAAATLVAAANEASTSATGAMTAAASDQAPVVNDPFANLSLTPPSCSGSGNQQTIATNTTLAAGTHVQPISIIGLAVVTLAPGDHYFCKTVSIGGTAKVTGSDVAMVFENGAILSFSGAVPVVGGIVSGLTGLGPSLSLSGRQSGPLAGFVIIADRGYTGAFTLQSDYITALTGTVYAPTADLIVQGTAKFGVTTPWTVVAAKSLAVNGGAQLVVNSNYAASSVPVPIGVGNQRQNVQLMQ